MFFKKQNKSAVSLKIMSAALIIAIGLGLSLWRVKQADTRLREDLVANAGIVAGTLDAGIISLLEGARSDLKSPVYEMLKGQLILIRTIFPECRFIYLTGKNTYGNVFFLIDSEEPGSPDESLPGDIYYEADPDLINVFSTGNAAVIGPSKDRWGEWVSAFIPLSDRAGNSYVFGMDIAVEDWNLELLKAGAAPFTVALILSLIIIPAGSGKNRENAAGKTMRRNYSAAIKAAAAGIILTFYFMNTAAAAEKYAVNRIFFLLAAAKSESAKETVKDIIQVQLEGR